MSRTNHSRHKKLLGPTLLALLFVCTASTNQPLEYRYESLSRTLLFRFEQITFTNSSLTGYISENVANPTSSSSSFSNAHNQSPAQASKSIFVRFVDQLKPGVTFDLVPRGDTHLLANDDYCKKFDLAQLGLSLTNSEAAADTDYAAAASDSSTTPALATKSDLFELDLNSFAACRTRSRNALRLTCHCYIKIKLIDGQSVRDRINREARDSYRIQLRSGLARAALLIHILDDNDLEPMFESSDYTFTLDEYRITPSGGARALSPARWAAFTTIGRVLATDPDLGQNGQARFYVHAMSHSECDKYLGVHWSSGQVFLKRSLTSFFADSELNECSLEVKSIDAGLKFNVINNLLSLGVGGNRHNSDLDTFNKFLIQTAASWNETQRKLTPPEVSLESTVVKVKLNRNLNAVLSGLLNRTRFTTIDKGLFRKYSDQIGFILDGRAGRVPVSLVRFDAAGLELDAARLHIRATNMSRYLATFRVAALTDTDFFLIYFDLNSELAELAQFRAGDETTWVNYKLEYCVDAVSHSRPSACVGLVEFNFDFANDLTELAQVLCSRGADEQRLRIIDVAPNAIVKHQAAESHVRLKLDRASLAPNMILFGVDKNISEFSLPPFCSLFSSASSNEIKPLLQVSGNKLSFNRANQVVLTGLLSRSETFELAQARLKLQIEYSSACDVIDKLEPRSVSFQMVQLNFMANKRVLYDLKQSARMIYCRLIYMDSSIENDLYLNATLHKCPFHVLDSQVYSNQTVSRFETIFRSAHILVQVFSNDSVEQHSFLNLNISINSTEASRVSLSSDESGPVSLHRLTVTYTQSERDSREGGASGGNNLEIPILIAKFDNVQNMDENIEFTVRVVNHTLDAKCFSINKFSGDLFLKSKIPYSILNQHYYKKQSSVAAEPSLVKRLVEIGCRIRQQGRAAEVHSFFIEVAFELSGGVVKRLDTISVNNLQPFALSLHAVSSARANRTEEIAQQYVERVMLADDRVSFARIKKRLDERQQHKRRVSTAENSLPHEMNLVSSNTSHFNFDLVCLIQNLTNKSFGQLRSVLQQKRYLIRANELIGQIRLEKLFTSNYMAERVFVFDFNSSVDSLFYIDRLSGEIRLLNELTPIQLATSSGSSGQRSFKFAFSLREVELFKSANVYQFLVSVSFRLELKNTNDLQFLLPSFSRQNYDLEIDKGRLAFNTSDLLLIKSFDFVYLNAEQEKFVKNMFNVTYAILKHELVGEVVDIPFYIDMHTGHVFYLNTHLPEHTYRFSIVIVYKFTQNDKLVFKQRLDVAIKIIGNPPTGRQAMLITHNESNQNLLTSKKVVANIDLEIPVTSTDLLMYVRSPLIGFIGLEDELIERHSYLTDAPVFKLILASRLLPRSNPPTRHDGSGNATMFKSAAKKAGKKTIASGKKKSSKLSKHRQVSKRDVTFLVNYFNNLESKNSHWNIEQELLAENFFSLLVLDSQTGALYFGKMSNSNHPLSFYSKMAKLIQFYYYERNMESKLIKLSVQLVNSRSNLTLTRWINLAFTSKPSTAQNQARDYLPTTEFHSNQFQINSNNLLNLFRNGDEFVLNVKLAENSQLFGVGDQRLVIDLNRYFKSKLAGLANEFIYLNLMKQLRFSLAGNAEDDDGSQLFEIENKNGNSLLYIRRPVQFDYELAQSHLVKVMIAQYLESSDRSERNSDYSDKGDHLVFSSGDGSERPLTFVYWLDLVINVVNEVDEPFLCAQPVYTIDVDENEMKNKRLLTLTLDDYEMYSNDEASDASVSLSRFKAQIVSGNAQGLFQMQGLAVHTGSSSRKLDRETRAQHELEIRVVDELTTNYTRAATCKLIVNVNDINDNRPIVNDVELTMYDKLDSKLIDDMRIPVANPIAVDQDQVAKLTYTIVSIKILNDVFEQTSENSGLEKRIVEYDDSSATAEPTRPIKAASANQAAFDTELAKLFYINTTTGYLYTTRTDMPCSDCIIHIQYKANDVGRSKTRVSRKSSIKLLIKPFPTALFRTSSFETTEASAEVELSAVKTFDLVFPNRSDTRIVLSINEDVKLGEKIYQLKTKPINTAAEQSSIVYFTLLEESNLNHTFYMANHDGSLYLIKQLDCDLDSSIHFYNLTVLVTNWLGQNDVVTVEVHVRDVNDNRPQFLSSSVHRNATVHIGGENRTSDHELVDLLTAFDLDQIDRGKLEFKVENCFYIGRNDLLIKKNHAYPLCGQQFVDLITSSPLIGHEYVHNSQLARLKIKIRPIDQFLRNSSNFYLRPAVSIPHGLVSFVLDISARDTSLLSSAVARVRLDVKFELDTSSKLAAKVVKVFKRDSFAEMMNIFRKRDEIVVEAGFRKPIYSILVRDWQQLRAGSSFMRLNDEFVWSSETSNNEQNSFQPFDLDFRVVDTVLSSFFSIDPHFGLLCLNESLFEPDLVNNLGLAGETFAFSVQVECKLAESARRKFLFKEHSQTFFRSTSLAFSIAKNILLKMDDVPARLEKISNMPIWRNTRAHTVLDENVPVGTPLSLGIEQFVNSSRLEHIKRNVLLEPSSLALSYSFIDSGDANLFSIEPSTGFIRVAFEPDYETRRMYSLNVQLCFSSMSLVMFKLDSLCFKQLLKVKVEIANKNDNEPSIQSLSGLEIILNLTRNFELMRSMSLFEFSMFDLDDEFSNQVFTYELASVSPNLIENSTHTFNRFALNSDTCPSLGHLVTLDWFKLFRLRQQQNSTAHHRLCIELTDLGFENLKLFLNNFNEQCSYRFALTSRIYDGLFATNTSFYLNIILNDMTKQPAFAPNTPTLHTLDVHSFDAERTSALLNVETLLSSYLSAKRADFVPNMVSFHLLNHRDTFEIDSLSYLWRLENATGSGNSSFRRHTYEIFIQLSGSRSTSYQLSERMRILIRFVYIIPRPYFLYPFEAKHTREIQAKFDQFYLNKTYALVELLKSNDSNAFMRVQASNDELSNDTFRLVYSIAACSLPSLFSVDRESGNLYMTPGFNINTLPKQDQVVTELMLRVENEIVDPMKKNDAFRSVSMLKIQFTLIARHSLDRCVYFKQTFYHFNIYESITIYKPFGFVNTAVYFNKSTNNSNIIYSILRAESDDPFQHFRINYRTGALYARSRLHFAQKSSYILMIKAYDSLNAVEQFATSHVRVDLIDVNDQAPTFSNYEYTVHVSENLPSMSQIFKLTASDADSSFLRNNEIRYTLLNHNSIFHIDEWTGVVYNKVSFDYEKLKNIPNINDSFTASSSTSKLDYVSQFVQNAIQLRVSARDLGMVYENFTLVPRSLQTSCLLTIYLINVNDNPPQFDKTVYFSQVVIDENSPESSSNQTIEQVLLDLRASKISNGSHHFVTKVSGKDIDLDRLRYSIVRQTYDAPSRTRISTRQMTEENLFVIEPHTGLVVLDRGRFEVFKNVERFIGKDDVKNIKHREREFSFNLQLSVCDGIHTIYSRLSVQVSYTSRLIVPNFVQATLEVSLDLTRLARNASSIHLIELDRLVSGFGESDFEFALNLDERDVNLASRNVFSLERVNENRVYLDLNLTSALYFGHIGVFQVPIVCCDRLLSGVCDQMLVVVSTMRFTNETSRLNVSRANSEIEHKIDLQEVGKHIGFLYHFYAFTIQQKSEVFSEKTRSGAASGSSENYSASSSNFGSFYDDLTADGVETSLLTSNNEYDYYTDEPYEANERFYFEVKILDLSAVLDEIRNATIEEEDLDYDDQGMSRQSRSGDGARNKHIKYEFELSTCLYSHLNATFTNSSLLKQIRQLLQHKNVHHPVSLTGPQLRPLFSLNKHNGVLSSRKIINLILPGVYLFNITLKISPKQPKSSPSNQTQPIRKVTVDQMQFRLVILPPNSLLKPSYKYIYNYFKFDKEFYKFKFNLSSSSSSKMIALGQVNLMNKFGKIKSSPKPDSYQIEYKLSENKFCHRASISNSSIYSMLTLNATSGLLSMRNEFKYEDLKPYLNDVNELVVYATATANMDALVSNQRANALSRLEYTCEININFNQFVIEHEQQTLSAAQQAIKQKKNQSKKQPEKSEDSKCSIWFGVSTLTLKLDRALLPNTQIYRFIALLHENHTLEDTTSLKYALIGGGQKMDSLFHLHPTTGRLTLAKSILAHIPISTLTVTACLDNTTILCATALVTIELALWQENSFRNNLFEHRQYNGTIRDDSLPGTIVTTLGLTQSHRFASLEFFILNNNVDSQFFAVANDGKVYTRLMIDSTRPLSPQPLVHLDLILIVENRLKCTTQLTISVLSVATGYATRPNVCGSQNFLKLDLTENVPLGYSLLNVPSLNSLKYEILTSEQETTATAATTVFNRLLPFGFDRLTGEIKTTGPIDYETNADFVFYLKISSTSSSSSSISNTIWTSFCLIKLRVNVLDLNDNRPEFTSTSTAVIMVQENERAGHVLAQAEADDADSNRNSLIVYAILPDRFSSLVSIDASSGLLVLSAHSTADLDREVVGNDFTLRINASNVLGDQVFTIKEMTVHLRDVNDNAPRFSQDKYFLSVEENLPAGTVITQLIAHDPDSNPLTEYYLLGDDSGQGSSYFMIEKSSGKVRIKSELDYETRRQHVLNVIAMDPFYKPENITQSSSASSKTQLLIDILDLNDNRPVFDVSTPADVYIDENMPVNSTVAFVQARDADVHNRLTYRILADQEAQAFFDIEPHSGRLFTKVAFDYEAQAARDFRVHIECVDNAERDAKTARTTVSVHVRDVNDNAPVFARQNQTIIIKENFPLGQEIAHVDVFDLDKVVGGEPFTFAILEQFKLSEDESRIQLADIIFAISPNGSLILAKKPLRNQSYLLKVRCYDAGLLYADSFRLVRIIDASSNEPRMADAFIDIVTIDGGGQQIFIGSDQVVGELEAFDADKQDVLYYELVPSLSSIKFAADARVVSLTAASGRNQSGDELERYFDVNKKTGLVKAKQPLNSSALFSLRASVTDKKFVTESTLNIMVENFGPSCLQNSLYAKFLLWPNDTARAAVTLTLDRFIQQGLLKRLRENLNRLLNVNSSPSKTPPPNANQNVVLLGLRHYYLRKKPTVSDEVSFDSYLELLEDEFELVNATAAEVETTARTALFLEVLFSVKSASGSSCLSNKPITKQLSKKRNVLLKRMQQAVARSGQIKVKLIDLSFNRDCLVADDKAGVKSHHHHHHHHICSTNMALQDCQLRFVGYNLPISQFCESSGLGNATNRCILLPEYEWNCESFSTASSNSISTSTPIATSNTNEPDEIVEIEFALSSGITSASTAKTTATTITSSSSTTTTHRHTSRYGHSCKKPHNPCQNNAICKQFKVTSLQSSSRNATKMRIHCFCPSGFRGKFCEEDIDECSGGGGGGVGGHDDGTNQKQPCTVDSVCVNTHGSFMCNCSQTPVTLCYNTLAPKYSASVVDLSQQIKNYKSGGFVEVEDPDYSLGGASDSNEQQRSASGPSNGYVMLLGARIPNHIVQQVILGVFGGLCALLIVLSILAAVVCKINMSKPEIYVDRLELRNTSGTGVREREKFPSLIAMGTTVSHSSRIHTDTLANTSNTSVDPDGYASSSSSPCSIQKPLPTSSRAEPSGGASSARFFRNGKNRSSMTVSLISANSETQRGSSKRNGYFGQFFARFNNNKTEPTASRLTELSDLNLNADAEDREDTLDGGFRKPQQQQQPLSSRHRHQQIHPHVVSSSSHVSSSLGEENEEEEESGECDEMLVTTSTYSPSSVENNANSNSNRVTVKSLKAKKMSHYNNNNNNSTKQKPSILIESSSLIQKATAMTTTAVSNKNQRTSSTTAAAVISEGRVQSSDNDADIDEATDRPKPVQQLRPTFSGGSVITDLRSFRRENKFNTLQQTKNSSTAGSTSGENAKYNTLKSTSSVMRPNGESASCRILPIVINNGTLKGSNGDILSNTKNNTSTFTSSTNYLEQNGSNFNNHQNATNKEDSINMAENCSLGFYWDITDWAGNIDNNNPDHHDGIVKEINYESPPLNDQSIDINIYNNSFYSNKAEFSPIYSKVFKNNRNESNKYGELTSDDLRFDDSTEPTTLCKNTYDTEDEHINLESKLSSFKANNYMFLVNKDEECCDRTFDSIDTLKT